MSLCRCYKAFEVEARQMRSIPEILGQRTLDPKIFIVITAVPCFNTVLNLLSERRRDNGGRVS